MKTSKQEAKVFYLKDYKTKEQRLAETRFYHLCDHLYLDPCFECMDVNTDYCLNECKSSKESKK